MAQVDYFLEIEGVPGESVDKAHKDEIEVESWSWGATQSGTSTVGGGAGAGRVSIQDFNFVSHTSKASPILFLSCASGKHITKATLTARKSGGTQAEFLTLTMTDVLISSYQIAGSEAADTVPLDQVSLNFSKIEFKYVPQTTSGAPGTPVSAGWDLKANKSV
jgi:type VI secretion system secreted protein Hcp